MWDPNLEVLDEGIPYDTLTDENYRVLSGIQIPSNGFLYSKSCFSVYVISQKGDPGWPDDLFMVTLDRNRNGIDTLPIRQERMIRENRISISTHLYVDHDTIIHLKDFLGYQEAPSEGYLQHRRYTILPNGVISPWFPKDTLENETFEGLIHREYQGLVAGHLPHGSWTISGLDLGINYGQKEGQFLYSTSIAEGTYQNVLRTGTWKYYSTARDTVNDPQSGMRYSRLTRKKGTKLLREEEYEGGKRVSRIDHFKEEDRQSFRNSMVEWAPRISFPKALERSPDSSFFISRYSSSWLWKVPNSRNVIRMYPLNTKVKVLGDDLNFSKKHIFLQNVLINWVPVEIDGERGFIDDQSLSTFPRPDSALYKKMTLEDFAREFPDLIIVHLDPKKTTFRFKRTSIPNVFQLMKFLRWDLGQNFWEEHPIFTEYEDEMVRVTHIKRTSKPIYSGLPLSEDGNTWGLLKVRVDLQKSKKWNSITLEQVNEDVILSLLE
ncbi:MAG: hypothetical protein LPK28_03385 [Bacteroidota bacterium]|nr:hypothetical protein [Bacteroidota bacterium]